jgi:hypothetical protein
MSSRWHQVRFEFEPTGKPDPGSPVTLDYRAPFPFTGTLHTVTLDLSGDLISDTEADMRIAMARQ